MKKLKIAPAEQRVIIQPDHEAEEILQSGIIIPSGTEVDKPSIGTIVAVGKGSKEYPMLYREGQRVLISNYAGVEVKLNLVEFGNYHYKVLNQMDIMATLIWEEN